MRRLCYAGLAAVVVMGMAVPAVRAQGGATIKGQVVWAGSDVPKQAPVNVNKDQAACLAKGPILNEEVVVNPSNKGVENVFVWITKTDGTKPPGGAKPAKPSVELDQPTCAFEPHALAMEQGQKLIVKNSAPVAHNVNWTGSPAKNPGGNVIVPPGKEHDVINLKADKKAVSVSCNIHGWMKAYIRVFDHPFFAVTDKDGKFEIKNAPTGNYKIWYWSDTGWKDGAAGSSGFPITIKSGENDLGKVEWKPSK